ncbi:ATP-dependent zinc protease family protein [Maridesulfovibrio zosterae]|uniref:ATP-dependent zinc protease family protein n=1 Tax=Maridesulfovibrio zosterae TaxID=82171 RepID=UPI000400E0AB|nr:ATP-dependent zinc protease [Maridesulfovibrio zosterae]
MEHPVNSYGRTVIGWREWAFFPELNIPAIKFKTDTGARTSCLHSFEHKLFKRNGEQWIKFGIHPAPKRTDIAIFCEAPVIDIRSITNSGGTSEERPVICTPINLGNMTWNIELTLTDRDSMKFRMLLGRKAMENRLIVDPSKSYILGKKLATIYDN